MSPGSSGYLLPFSKVSGLMSKRFYLHPHTAACLLASVRPQTLPVALRLWVNHPYP